MSHTTAMKFGLSHREFTTLMEFSPIMREIADPNAKGGESLRAAAHATLMVSIVILTLASIGIVLSLIVYVIYYQKNRRLDEQLKRSYQSRAGDGCDFDDMDEKTEPSVAPLEEPPDFKEKDFDTIRVSHVALSASYFNYRKRLQINLKAINVEPIPISHREVIAKNAYIYAVIEVERSSELPTINFETDLQNIDTENHFDETCEFDISLEEVHNLQIRMSVFGCDRFSRNRLLCKLLFMGARSNPDEMDATQQVVQSVKLTEAYRTYSSTQRSVTVEPQVMCSLCYMPTSGRLTVVALKAVCLCEDVKYVPVMSYLRITLSVDGKFVKTTQTQTTKKSLNPIYNEAFMFNVPLESLASAEITISVYLQQQANQTATLWGKIFIGPQSTGEKGRKHWEMMLASVKKPVAQWHRVNKSSGQRQLPTKQPPQETPSDTPPGNTGDYEPPPAYFEQGGGGGGVGDEIPIGETISMEELQEEMEKMKKLRTLQNESAHTSDA